MANAELTQCQRELLASIPERFLPDRVDRLWIFPPHRVKNRESGFVVLSLLPPDDAGVASDRRVLVTIRYDAEATSRSTRRNDRITEEGMAPPARIDRVISGVLARVGGDDVDPIVEELGGDADRWLDFVDRLGLSG